MAQPLGLLVITNELTPEIVGEILSASSPFISSKLYIYLRSPSCQKLDLTAFKWYSSIIYSMAESILPEISTYVLLPKTSNSLVTTSRSLDIVITDDASHIDSDILSFATEAGSPTVACRVFRLQVVSDTARLCDVREETKTYPSVCVGGTFDSFHQGHKLLLSTAALLATRRLLVGVTTSCLLTGKLLAPLIQCMSSREASVKEFLKEIGFPEEAVEIFHLSDPFGPPATQSDFQCIVASPETLKGCKKINGMREALGFSAMHIEVVDYVEHRRWGDLILPQGYRDVKFSSSTLRMNLLGRLIREPVGDARQSDRHVIGLTGPVASGKTSVAKLLLELSGDAIRVVDVDAIFQRLHTSDRDSYAGLAKYFALEPLRALVEPLTLGEQERRDVIACVESELRLQQASNESTVVLESAHLFDVAGLDALCDEIWTVYVPLREAVSRISNEKEPIKVDQLMENLRERGGREGGGSDWWSPCQRNQGRGPIGRSNVVFCTSWDKEFTKRQVTQAWERLSKVAL